MSFMGVLHDRAERRAIIVPAGSLEQPTESFVLGTGGITSSAGVPVTQRTAEGIPTVFACDKVIKQDVAKSPIEVKRLGADGSRQVDRAHPAYAVLHDQANPVITDYEFKETLQGYLNLWGNAYAEIIRTMVSTNVTPKKRLALQLWPLDSARMTVDLDNLNRLRYRYQMLSGVPKEWIFDPSAPPIFHLRQNSRDGIVGRSPVQVLREAMGTTIAQDRYVGRLYGQGGHPRVALSTSQKLTDTSARRIRSDFETLTVGEHNWHRVVVLDHDLKPVPLVMPNRDAQFLQLVQLSDMRLCGAFRIAPHKIANLERSTNNNIEQQAIEHVGDCLMPNFICWQKAIARDLLNPISYGTHVAMFDVDELMRGDSVAMSTALNQERQNGVITANGWLRRLGRDDQISDADGGNLYLVNGNMMPMRRDPAASMEMPLPVPQGGAN